MVTTAEAVSKYLSMILVMCSHVVVVNLFQFPRGYYPSYTASKGASFLRRFGSKHDHIVVRTMTRQGTCRMTGADKPYRRRTMSLAGSTSQARGTRANETANSTEKTTPSRDGPHGPTGNRTTADPIQRQASVLRNEQLVVARSHEHSEIQTGGGAAYLTLAQKAA